MFDSRVQWLRKTVPCASALGPAELVEAMGQLHRLESVLAERKLSLIAALTAHRDAEADERAGEDPAEVARWACTGWEIAESEVGAALTVGRHRAGVLMSLGVALRDRLPWVRAAMAAGDLDPYRAGLIHDATATSPRS